MWEIKNEDQPGSGNWYQKQLCNRRAIKCSGKNRICTYIRQSSTRHAIKCVDRIENVNLYKRQLCTRCAIKFS